MRLGHTVDSQKLTEFAERLNSKWHTYKKDKKTLKAVERAKLLGRIETNEFDQFRIKQS